MRGIYRVIARRGTPSGKHVGASSVTRIFAYVGRP
jgi:hypothetical protein